jgi:hypothetical protein
VPSAGSSGYRFVAQRDLDYREFVLAQGPARHLRVIKFKSAQHLVDDARLGRRNDAWPGQRHRSIRATSMGRASRITG